MPSLSQQDLKAVAAEAEGPALSLFMPTHRAGPPVAQDPIRLKNLLKEAERQLIAEGMRAPEARDLLAPLSALVEDAAFWRRQDHGLAVFRSPGLFRLYHLPFAPQEFVTVAGRFYVAPLLPLFVDDAGFYVMAISQKAVRLLRCSRHEVQEIEVPEDVRNMEAALPLGATAQQQMYQLPRGNQKSGMFHGHGEGIDDADVTNLTRYSQRIVAGLHAVLGEDRAPMVLACVEYIAPIFRAAARGRTILTEIVAGNPDGLSNAELHAKAQPIAEAHFRRTREQAAADFQEGIAKGRAGKDLAEVLAAAHQGRIATLFVPRGSKRWGRYRFDQLSLQEHELEEPGDEELLGLAASQTFLRGGTVYAVAPNEMPNGEQLAAVYRF
jgi:hypothetical protein